MKKIMRTAALFLATVTLAIAGTQYLGSDTLMNYGPSRTVVMAGGQTVTTEDGTGYVAAGRLASYKDHFIYYGSGRDAIFLKNSLAEFSGGYISKGILYENASNSQWLYYGSSNSSLFLGNSVANFSGGYLVKGWLYNGNYSVPYGNGSVYVNILAVTEFEPGPSGAGVVKACILSSNQFIQYGPSRQAYFRGSGEFTQFSGGYISLGTLDNGNFLTTSSGNVYRAAGTVCNFSGGYYIP